MAIFLKRASTDLDGEKLASAVLHPEGRATKPNQLVRLGNVIGRRDPLSEIQQKVLIATISLIHAPGDMDSMRTVGSIHINQFLKLCNIKQENMHLHLTGELEKLALKGLWLYEKSHRKLTRSQWFQTIEYANGEIAFQFTDKIVDLLATIEPNDIECQLIKGIQYRGKHTLAVDNIIRFSKAAGVTEYSIPEMMKKLSLEYTRYSYGQLKLRVLEPSLQEIYDWDDAIFVRFGPAFSGRRAEGMWFEVTTGEEARKLRKKEPEFKFALPEE